MLGSFVTTPSEDQIQMGRRLWTALSKVGAAHLTQVTLGKETTPQRLVLESMNFTALLDICAKVGRSGPTALLLYADLYASLSNREVEFDLV